MRVLRSGVPPLEPILDELRALKPYWPLAPDGRVLLAALGALLLLTALLLALRALARRRPAPAPSPERVAETALDAWKRIAQDGLVRPERAVACHERLDALLKTALGARFGFQALELTTSEIDAELTAARAEPSEQERIAGVLRAGDWVKFARGSATAEEIRAHYEAVGALLSTWRERAA